MGGGFDARLRPDEQIAPRVLFHNKVETILMNFFFGLHSLY